MENAIAAATLAPVAHTVSKKWVTINASFTRVRLDTLATDFDFQCLLLMMTSFICSPKKRKEVKRATRTSAAVGFEPTPAPEEELRFISKVIGVFLQGMVGAVVVHSGRHVGS